MKFRSILFHWVIGVLLFPATTECTAQNTKIDSLKKLALRASGKVQVDLFNRLAFELGTVNNKLSKEAAQRALQLGEQIHYAQGTAEALVFDGITEYSVGHDRVARRQFNRSIAISQRIGNNNLEAYSLTHLGMNYQNLDNLDSAGYCFDRALVLLKNGGNAYYTSFLYLVLADYYEIKGETENQIQFLRKCWEIREKTKGERTLPYVGVRIAAYHSSKGEYDLAMSYLNKSQAVLGKDTLDNEEICVIRQGRATILARQGFFLQALKLFHAAKAYYEQNGFPLELANLLSETGELFSDLGNYETSLKSYFEGLTIAEKNHYDFQRIRILLQIGWIYMSLEQFPLSKEFVEKAMSEAKLHHHQHEEAYAYNLMGVILVNQARYDQARNYFDQALRIRQKVNDKIGVAGTLSNLGWLLEKQNNLTDALVYQRDALAIEEAVNHQIGIALSYEVLGQLYTKAKDYQRAEEYLKKDEALAKKLKASSVLLDAYKYRRDLLIKQQRPNEALQYSIRYENLKDSIYSKNLSSRISSLENAYELEKKEEEIKLLNKNKQLQERELAIEKARVRQQWIVIGGGVGVVIFFGVVAFLLFQKNKKIKSLNYEIQEQNEEIRAQSEELTESNNQLNLLNEQLAAQKEEIATQNEELIQSQENLSQLNSHLERLVVERTKEVHKQNEQLISYAYSNAHHVRGPVARVLGLIQLSKMEVDLDYPFLFQKIEEQTKEIDEVVKRINRELEK